MTSLGRASLHLAIGRMRYDDSKVGTVESLGFIPVPARLTRCGGSRGSPAEGRLPASSRVSRPGRDRGPLPAQGDLDPGRRGGGLDLHALAPGPVLSPAAPLWTAGGSGPVPPAGARGSVPGELDRRELGPGDLHAALGH